MGDAVRVSEGAGSGRLLSIDALRGFDMFWIAGGDTLANAILSQIDTPSARSIRDQFEHVDWAGFRFYDLIFPLFMFLVGTVIPFSLDKYRSVPSDVYGRIARRVAALFFLGLVCNGLLRFEFGSLRYAGVLQRIAICYGIASVCFLLLSRRAVCGLIAGILLGYWALLAWVPVPGGVSGDYSKEGNLCGYVDRLLLPGRIPDQWYGFGDNEGLLSTMPAITTVLMGCLAGMWLRTSRSGWEKSAGLIGAGLICLMTGIVWGWKFPIIKNLWTSSFVLVAGGWSLLFLAVFYTVIDVLGYRRWAFVWTVVGVNAITIYIVPRIIDFDHISEFFLKGVAGLSGGWSSAILAAGTLTAEWLFLFWLYRNRLFLRL